VNPIDVLITRAKVAAGCSWNAHDGGPSNATLPQEPEVRNILRDCARTLEGLKREANNYAEVIDFVREALGQDETHYLVVADDVKELVDAVELCASDGGCRAKTVLERLRANGRAR
jgi:hypothetical protein